MMSANFGLGGFSLAVGLADGALGGRAVALALLIKSGNQPLSHCRESLGTYSYQTSSSVWNVWLVCMSH